MAFQSQREAAHRLRKEGRSIAEISKILAASKSTVSYWCRDITLSATQQEILVEKQRIAGGIGRLRAAENKRARRIEMTAADMTHGARDVGALSQRDMLILGLALYWGEGYKSGNEECGLTNSDAGIILAFIEFLERTYNIQKSQLILRVSLNESHRSRVGVVEKYWSGVTRIPLSQFTSTSLIKTRAKKIYLDQEKHFGTLRVKIRRGTSLRRRIMGSLTHIRRQITK